MEAIFFTKNNRFDMNNRIIGLLLVLGLTQLTAQKPEPVANGQAAAVSKIQPIIMVIPYTKEGEDIRKVLESDISKRVALAKVNEAFGNRRFMTRDFVATLKALEVDKAFRSENQSDIKSQIIEASGADIYVEVEVAEQKGADNSTSVRLILRAYDAFTSFLLSNKTGSSGKFFTTDISRLVENCLKQLVGDTPDKQTAMLELLLNEMNERFTDVNKDGRSLKVEFTLSPNTMYTFDSSFGDKNKLLSELIEEWMEQNTYKNSFGSVMNSDKIVSFTGAKIPLLDSDNKNYSPSKFATSLLKFCNSLVPSDNKSAKLKVTRATRGGTIYITVQ
jgi:Family of unknown function (DUF6175)